MSELLKTNTSLKSLDLSSDKGMNKQINNNRLNTNYCNKAGNGIGFEGIKMLIESLKINSVLTNFSLRGKI